MEAHLQPESMFGLRHLPSDTRAKLVQNGKLIIDRHHKDLVEPFVRRMHKCLLKLRNKPDMMEEIGTECRSVRPKFLILQNSDFHKTLRNFDGCLQVLHSNGYYDRKLYGNRSKAIVNK